MSGVSLYCYQDRSETICDLKEQLSPKRRTITKQHGLSYCPQGYFPLGSSDVVNSGSSLSNYSSVHWVAKQPQTHQLSAD